MEPFGFESGPSRAMLTFKTHEESYHRCSQAINRHINGLQLGKVEAIAAIDLPVDLEEAEQHVSYSLHSLVGTLTNVPFENAKRLWSLLRGTLFFFLGDGWVREGGNCL